MKLSHQDATLVLCDVNVPGLIGTAALCARGTHDLHDVDVASTQQVNEFIGVVIAKFNAIHHVFNCAGVNPTSYPLENTTDEYWDKLVNTNLKGTYNVTRACIPHMKEGSSFVNVSSISGLHPSANQAIYCATKYAIIGFSKCMALELGPKGIRTNIVAPGYIDTPTNAGIIKGGEFVARMEKGTALGRLGTPEEVADVVMFLFGEESRYMNGSVVEIDGGLRS